METNAVFETVGVVANGSGSNPVVNGVVAVCGGDGRATVVGV